MFGKIWDPIPVYRYQKVPGNFADCAPQPSEK